MLPPAPSLAGHPPPCRAPARTAVLGAPGTGAEALVAALHAAAPTGGPAHGWTCVPVHLEADTTHPARALQALRASGCTQAWLMGLDGLPPAGVTATGNGGADARERQDATLRDLLHMLGWTYVVFYGPPAARLRQAMALLEPAGAAMATAGPPAARPRPTNQREPAWGCEKCSDPDCERRLFQRLITQDNARA